jgi:hypothetical protein
MLPVIGRGQVLLAVNNYVYAQILQDCRNPRETIDILVSQQYRVDIILMHYLLQIVDEKARHIAVPVANL